MAGARRRYVAEAPAISRTWGGMTNLFGEWPDAQRYTPWLWVPLLVGLAAPFPYGSFPLPERGVPLLWILASGGLCLFGLIARVSWPFAAILGWGLARVFITGIWIEPSATLQAGVIVMDAGRARPLQVLLVLALASLLYLAAREMSTRTARVAAWALVVGVAWEFVFGYLNLWKVYPWMTFVLPDHLGRPMGFLTHPNYWGSFMALGLPIVWSLAGILPALAIFAVLAASWSAGPVIAAAVGVGLLLWPELSRRLRYWLVGGLSAAVAVVMTVHEWRLSGRREVWAAFWPELMRYPVIGQGLGAWRGAADAINLKRSAASGTYEVFATLQAHNEPYQLWFELGLIGLFLAALWMLQAGLAGWVVWHASEATVTRWWAPGRVPLERAFCAVLVIGVVNALGSPTFHLPAQAAFLLFALGRTQARASHVLAIQRLADREEHWRAPSPRLPKKRLIPNVTIKRPVEVT